VPVVGVVAGAVGAVDVGVVAAPDVLLVVAGAGEAVEVGKLATLTL
jgi:hypothetical protein